MRTKKKPTKRSVARKLRKRASDADVARWATAHDVFDRINAGVSEIVDEHDDLDIVLEDALSEDNTTQLNMRVPPAMKAVLMRLARERTTDATTLARIWLAERLRDELGRR
jgi:hypothetical protein